MFLAPLLNSWTYNDSTGLTMADGHPFLTKDPTDLSPFSPTNPNSLGDIYINVPSAAKH